MKLPPALSWMHLFPRAATFECDASVPEPLRACSAGFESAPASSGDRRHKSEAHATAMRVCVGKDVVPCADGFVGINSRTSNHRLNTLGFTYIRRFAVLPDLATARWFVPLDSPAVSSAAFSLYSPARFSARLKVAAARVAAYTRLPVWYRDTIVIAQKQTPPIERKMAELFHGSNFRLALSSGAPEPARNRKVSVAIIGTNGTIIGFGKIAGSALSRLLMGDESRALPELNRRNIGAPIPLLAGDVDGSFVTVQKPLSGKPVSSKLTPNKLALLRSLRSTRLQLASESNMVATMPARVAEHPMLAEALRDVLPILAQTRVPSTIVHGDFAPWNLREHNGQCVAFDWEYAELDGLPLLDETHYRLQVGYLLNDWDLDRAAAMLDQMRLHNDLSLSIEQVRAIQVVYLLDNLARLFAEGYDQAENEMVGWYCKLLARLTLSRKEMVAA